MFRSLGGLGDSLVLFSIFFALLLVLWADPSNKYRSVDGYPGRCFTNYTSHKSSELSSADGDRERGNSAENNGV
ncbi:hypothetical protein L3X38_006093 [Prunus dulcis]|uniref:Uncharacterized protein n=1 Tax=Prunus dulcis TaxID=3755 RepID=A0AAD4ZS13_PRUDU|nr:hypothetical protein L3X38_006093 [Prunus dulcis]